MADPLDCLVDGGAEVVEFPCKLFLAELQDDNLRSSVGTKILDKPFFRYLSDKLADHAADVAEVVRLLRKSLLYCLADRLAGHIAVDAGVVLAV
jgi:hypothetical protein